MILDRGTCRISRKVSTTQPGSKPTWTWETLFEGYYAELDFATSPARPSEGREDTETATRIRILQCRAIRNQDMVDLTPFDGTTVKTEKYRITRAWHGADGDTGEPISDLTLEVDEMYPITIPTPAPATGGNGSGGDSGTTTQETGQAGQESGQTEVTGSDGE